VATTLLAMVLSSCLPPPTIDDRGLEFPPCECPNLIDVFESVDWVPGEELPRYSSHTTEDGQARILSVMFRQAHYPTLDPDAAVERLRGLLEDAGFEPQDRVGPGFTVDETSWSFRVSGGTFADGSVGDLSFGLRINHTDDSRVRQELAPLVEALGAK